MKRFSDRQLSGGHSMAELNITPLLDLCFVLLIIFLITTPLMEQGINVNTPSASPISAPLDPASVKTVSLDKAGAIFLDGTPVGIAELGARLEGLLRKDPKLAVGIRADKALAYEKVVDVIDVLQKVGVKQFGLITRVESR